MVSKIITDYEIKEAIAISFEGDNKIKDFYDLSVTINSLNDIVFDISNKLSEYKSLVKYGVYHKNKLIGYYVYEKNILISFALNIKYRTKKFLDLYFRLIKKSIGDEFICFLWSENKRGIKWLCKVGMKVEKELILDNRLVTLLIYF
jgi:hypothetical protein